MLVRLLAASVDAKLWAADVMPGGCAIIAASSGDIGLGSAGSPCCAVDSFRVNRPISRPHWFDLRWLIHAAFGCVSFGAVALLSVCASPVRLTLISLRGERITTGSP